MSHSSKAQGTVAIPGSNHNVGFCQGSISPRVLVAACGTKVPSRLVPTARALWKNKGISFASAAWKSLPL
eukprot:scaffold3169_cov118-Amphora_coffeaeformis.AAC.2